MKNSVIAFSAASLLLISLIIVGTFKTGFVAALAATSTSAASTGAKPAIGLADTASSTPSTSASSTVAALAALTTATSTAPAPVTDNATTTANASSATSSPNQAKPHGNGKPALERVRVVGSKYIDFFSDGATILSFPGDPSIDANLNKPNAPMPAHAGLTWVSSKGMEAYDTASGDLEPGSYAQEANGSFIANVSGFPASATSTTLVAFSLLDPTLDASPHAAAADTSAASTSSPLPDTSTSASSTPNASTTTSASSTTAASVALTTPNIASATSTATSTAVSSLVPSSSFASANDNAASTTATQ